MFAYLFRALPNTVTQNITAAYFKIQAYRTVGCGSHSLDKVFGFPNMDVKILPALQDNYMYLIIDKSTRDAAIVDPVDPESVLKAVKSEEVNLKKILTTHHHWDHAGGNEKLVSLCKEKLEVFGGDDRIHSLTNKVKHNDTLTIGNINVKCLFTPCHTSGHICYEVSDNEGNNAVFTGDTLFSAGCGRFFEGTPNEMYHALIEILSQLPDNTKVFCGHEYTLQNLAFAVHVEPDNKDILDHIEWTKKQRNDNIPTVPSSIEIEKKINPFMRVHENSVQKHTGKNDAIETMCCLRKEKDSFKGHL